MQPSEFWQLSLPEAAELTGWMNEYVKRQQQET
jgi:hypothetical protein